MQYFAIKFMNWSELIEKLSRDFRVSEVELASKVGITYPTINRIRRGITDKPNQSTIRQLEEGLGIKIDDSDLENLTYKLIGGKEQEGLLNGELHLYKYPILSQVYAGGSMALFVQENIQDYTVFSYPKHENCFAVTVSGDSMKPRIEPGDIILVDMEQQLTNGCIVIARLKDGKQVIKRYRELSEDTVLFYSDNGGYEPLSLSKQDIEAIYRVVRIQKNV